MKNSGVKLTPDKLPAEGMVPIDAACQKHLATVITTVQLEFLIGGRGLRRETTRRCR